jgi:nicotinate-nucleotide adenylyltransferase
VASAAHRLAMLDLAVAEFPGLVVDPREIERAGKSYTVLTLTELRAEHPARPLVLIVGTDAFLGLPTWHRWRELFGLAHIVVVTRPGAPLAGSLPGELADDWERRRVDDPTRLASAPAGTVMPMPIPPQPISATAIRRLLAEGQEAIAQARGLLPPAVLAYIDRNRLYRSRPDAT